MAPTQRPKPLREALARLKRILKRLRGPQRRPEPEAPGDPYAMVGAPLKPRPPVLRGAARAQPEN